MSCDNIWKKRKKLTQTFWNKIAPEEWKKVLIRKNSNTEKKKKRYNPSQCLDPFHFLPKVHDFTKQLPTKCPCSEYHRRSVKRKSTDIRTFLTKFPILKAPTVKNYSISSELLNTAKHTFKRFCTQADKIRDQHDRGKRKK